jgi:CRISPR-associated protein Cas5d
VKVSENMRTFCLEVSGDFACFTRPEMKVERVSYDVMTPSAARGILEAIFWHPGTNWRVHRIEVLHPIRWMNLRRNEVGQRLSTHNVLQAMASGERLALFIEEERQQRAGLFLRDVAYRIHAGMDVALDPANGVSAAKYEAIFERRADKGQCFHRPYLGCREFAADFRLVTGPSAAVLEGGDRDLGWMLYDLDYAEPSDPKPRFFNARLRNGAMEVPAWGSPEVRG